MRKIKIGKKEANKEYGFRETCFGIYSKNNQFYLVRDNYQHSLIGGGLEKDETHEECLKREFLEESGLQISSIKEFYTIDCFWATHTGYLMESLAHFYIINNANKIGEPLDKDSKLVIIDEKNLLQHLQLPYQRKAIEEFLKINKKK